MNRLIIDSSTPKIYVTCNGETLWSKKDMHHLESITHLVNKVLPTDSTIYDLNEIVVGLGPGSYTGSRVGVLFVKAMAESIRLINPELKTYGVQSEVSLGNSINPIKTDQLDYYSKNEIPVNEVIGELKPIYLSEYVQKPKIKD